MAKGIEEANCLEKVIYIYENSIMACKSYGLTLDEINKIEKILINIKPNPDLSKFPDFLFDDGFIEHFQITSSKENKKGSTQRRDESHMIKENIESLQLASDKLREENAPPIFGVRINKLESCEHSYNNFENSFKKNFESHINSLNKYSGKKDIGIFMIEYTDIGVEMCENMNLNFKSDISIGTLVPKADKHNTIYLSRCKKLLEYISNYHKIIKYIIYVTHNDIEIIKTSEAKYIMSLLKNDYNFYPINGINLIKTTGII